MIKSKGKKKEHLKYSRDGRYRQNLLKVILEVRR